MAASGAAVIINYANNSEAAAQTAQEIKKNGGLAFPIKGDVTDEPDAVRMIEEAEQAVGRTVDILINNATGPQPELSIEESTWADYEDQLRFFVKAPLLAAKAVLPGMKKNGWGRIITIGSEVVQLGTPNFANYVTAKSAQLGMTRSWANELGAAGITVNLVNPGFIPVERHGIVDSNVYHDYVNSVPLRKMGDPQDVADTVAFLASDGAQFITGQSISVNGGKTFGV